MTPAAMTKLLDDERPAVRAERCSSSGRRALLLFRRSLRS